jgi:bifunctional DNase/RNase
MGKKMSKEKEKEGYLRITDYELLSHPVTESRVIQLTAGEMMIGIPIEMFAVRTFFRSILSPEHSEKLLHGVVIDIVSQFNAKIIDVAIYDLVDNLYLTKLHLTDANDKDIFVEIDSGDALAIALKSGCYVFVAEKVFSLHQYNRLHWYDAYAPNLVERLKDIEPDTFVKYPEYDLTLFIEKAVAEDEFELAAVLQKALASKKR